MSRGFGLVRVLQDAVPPALVPVFVAITTLGSVSFLLVVLSLLDWLDDRELQEQYAAEAQQMEENHDPEDVFRRSTRDSNALTGSLTRPPVNYGHGCGDL